MAAIPSPAPQFDAALHAALATVQQRHAAIAKASHAAVMQADPRPIAFTRHVDGRRDAPEEAVKRDGVIVYDYPRIEFVAEFAVGVLRALSPVDTGTYRDAHSRFLNDVPVKDFKAWRSGDKAIVANFVEYARKIEVGAMKMKVPGTDHVYQQAAQIIRADPRRGPLMNVRFTFVSVNLNTGTIYRPAKRSPETRWPALILSEKAR